MPLFGGWMVALGVAFWLVPAGQPVLRLAAGLSAVAAIAWGLRSNRAGDRTPWRWLAVAVGLSSAGAFAYSITPSLRDLGVVLIIATYPVLAAALLVFIRRRTGAIRDRAALLDALVVTAGGALLVWTFLLDPRLAERDWVMLAYPLGDLLCLGVLTRLLTASGRRLASSGLLGAGLVVMLLADIGYELGW